MPLDEPADWIEPEQAPSGKVAQFARFTLRGHDFRRKDPADPDPWSLSLFRGPDGRVFIGTADITGFNVASDLLELSADDRTTLAALLLATPSYEEAREIQADAIRARNGGA